MPARHARGFKDADRAIAEFQDGGEQVVVVYAVARRVTGHRDAGETAGADRVRPEEESRRIDVMGPEVAERAGAGRGGVIAPPAFALFVESRRDEKIRAIVIDGSEFARLDELPRQLHGREEAVVERAHMFDARRLRFSP